jgi:hypothetical protein
MNIANATCVALLAWVAVPVGGADWDLLNFRFSRDEENTVKGPGEAFVSVRPSGGPWTASFGAANHFANLKGETIRVYSARVVDFNDYNTASGNAGQTSHIVFKIELSEPVTEAVWDIENHGRNVQPPARLTARYGTDGSKWLDAYSYPAGGPDNHDPPPVTLRFDPPTQVLYLGWFAEVPGGTGWWLIGTTGQLAFKPLRSPEASAPAGPEEAAKDDLQGPRVVPESFFGTTTHVNSEGAMKLLQDLGIRNVRIDFHWGGLEPARGAYNFGPDIWMMKSAELGIGSGLDQLVVLTTPPRWAEGPRGTWPNVESAPALEELMFRIASKYKGKIRHWQACNEPNMAVWRESFIEFLKAYHHGVKRADPENKVILCGFAGVEHLHLEAVYRLGGKDYFDILGAHPYTRPALPEDGGYLDRIRAIRAVMRKHGDQKPIWVDEMGWNGVEPSMLEYLKAKYEGHRNYAVTEEDQARGLARLYLISATIPWIERVYFFHLHQEAAYTDVAENVDWYMGLFTPWLGDQIRPKDAYHAVKTVIGMLKGAAFRERIESAPRIWALLFERAGEALVALWSLDDGVSLTLEDPSMIQGVTSMVGTPVLISKSTLRLSGRPLYLRAGLEDIGRFKEQLRRSLPR